MNKYFVLYPFLFSIYPVISISSNNINEVSDWSSVLVLILISLFVALIFLIIGKALFKNKLESYLICFFLILFFYFFPILEKIVLWFFWILNIKSINFFDYEIGHKKTSLFFYLFIILISILVYYFIRKRTYIIKNLNNFFFFFSFFLFIVTITQLSYEFLKKHNFTLKKYESKIVNSNIENRINLPNIYFIVLDAYAGDNSLKKIFNYNNIEFLNFLKNNKFKVLKNSYSNYQDTHTSITSTLNMDYLHNSIENFSEIKNNYNLTRSKIYDSMQNNYVFKLLKNYGYTIINHNSDYGFSSNLKNADFNINCSIFSDSMYLYYFQSTLIGSFEKQLRKINLSFLYDSNRKNILCNFDSIKNLKNEFNSPFFSFSHFLSPHPPFLFKEDGSKVNFTNLSLVDEISYLDKKLYIGQLKFINFKTKDLIKNILANDKESIIIIQSDHGSKYLAKLLGSKDNDPNIDRRTIYTSEEELEILNAIYLPKGKNQYIYDGLTPVNTFRLIFKHFMKLDIETIEDKNYYNINSHYNRDYNFEDVTNFLKNN